MKIAIEFKERFWCETHKLRFSPLGDCCQSRGLAIKLKNDLFFGCDMVYAGDINPETGLSFGQLRALGEGDHDL